MDTTNNSLEHVAEIVTTKKAWTTPEIRKAWTTPEIRDQSIRSLTEGKPVSWPTEASASTGS
ncbi:hypothetical protein [Methylomonas fluvii]|uniref:Uncharacterized protein n=1 Tax=Methylomonas fluvii TaxID=1854564 RepID=A0ABR9DKL0_9GAMM|nr:hypothetical protein [Methylomonas fluvii]MBD9362422.1 hypothetical protein [Methylomonas fluvii]CAD6875522.1 hypothetical protein [Methylomonas fluvii]